MQEQRGAIGSFSETFSFEHGSSSNDIEPRQDYISLDSPPDGLSDYISLNLTNEEDQDLSMWTAGEASSSSGPNQMNTFGPSSDPFESDDHRISRKRKAAELSIGQSSSSGESSNMFQTPDSGSSQWVPIGENTTFDPTIPRLGLGLGGVFSRQQDPLPAANDDNVNNNRQMPQIDTRSRSPPVAEATPDNLPNNPSPPVRTLPLRRNIESTSRWARHSAFRATRSANLDSVSDHPIFAQSSNNSSNGGDGSQAGPSSGRDALYRARRLSYLRRSLLSAAADLEADGGHSSNIIPRIPPALSTSLSSSSQDLGIPPVASMQDQQQQQPQSRSSLLLSRHLGGRGRLTSEIRSVLDLMRRGERVRFEDLMLLDQSVFFGIADNHDRHRDMRLDIDNMSYEELLALEERIGNVNTGLTEEKITKHMMLKQYVVETGHVVEPCCICQEEYKDGDDLGGLECKHDFHRDCIKQWLQQKNSCPICKSTVAAK
ncbi:zinc finger, RING/FYVE/PHD-type [Artemisia annua]|uniref:RING-type E3 ubiquitin transferase n=1 Tax=Artemisia annua TaxID=35608 RepID=A0A2U1LZA7_ARTAN|nr:zinc finger, RING/FYVE/PHD-type [Artemisia annua]